LKGVRDVLSYLTNPHGTISKDKRRRIQVRIGRKFRGKLLSLVDNSGRFFL